MSCFQFPSSANIPRVLEEWWPVCPGGNPRRGAVGATLSSTHLESAQGKPHRWRPSGKPNSFPKYSAARCFLLAHREIFCLGQTVYCMSGLGVFSTVRLPSSFLLRYVLAWRYFSYLLTDSCRFLFFFFFCKDDVAGLFVQERLESSLRLELFWAEFLRWVSLPPLLRFPMWIRIHPLWERNPRRELGDTSPPVHATEDPSLREPRLSVPVFICSKSVS